MHYIITKDEMSHSCLGTSTGSFNVYFVDCEYSTTCTYYMYILHVHTTCMYYMYVLHVHTTCTY